MTTITLIDAAIPFIEHRTLGLRNLYIDNFLNI